MFQTNFTIYNILSILTCFVGVLYAFQIKSLKRSESTDNRYFTSYLLVLSSIVFLFFIMDLSFKIVYVNLLIVFLLIPLVLLTTPLMWLYIRKLTSYGHKRKTIIHFFPSIISSILILIFGLLFLVNKTQIYIDLLTYLVMFSMIGVFLVQNVYYIFLSIVAYKRYKRIVKDIYSYTEEVDLSWLKILLSGYVFFIVGVILVNSLGSEKMDKVDKLSSYNGVLQIELFHDNAIEDNDRIKISGLSEKTYNGDFKIKKIDSKTFYVPSVKFIGESSIKDSVVECRDKFMSAVTNIIFNLIIFLYIIYTGYNALKQKGVTVSNDDDDFLFEETKDKVLPEGQSLIFQKIKEDLLEIMTTEKPYLDQDLNIFSLAKRLNTNSKYLSQVINQDFNKSFVHFVNEYRIEEAKQILLTNSNYTIEAQSQMVGFKSKSSFNIAFKRHTGLTPSLYIQGNR